jgi:hypothetical protein
MAYCICIEAESRGCKGKEENEAGSEGVVCLDRHHGEHGSYRGGPGNGSVSRTLDHACDRCELDRLGGLKARATES